MERQENNLNTKEICDRKGTTMGVTGEGENNYKDENKLRDALRNEYEDRVETGR